MMALQWLNHTRLKMLLEKLFGRDLNRKETMGLEVDKI
jgi:hypothetical protein